MPSVRRARRKRRKALSIALGFTIRWRREERGWSQEELAHRAKLHPTYVGGVERGERNITVESLFKLALGLEVPAATLIADTQRLLDLPRREWRRD